MSLSSILTSTMFCLLAMSMLMVAAAPTQEQETEPESDKVEEKSCNKLHAAFVFRNTYFFIFGDFNYMSGFNRAGTLVYNGYGSNIHPFPYEATAAVGFPEYDMFFLISGKHEQGFNDFSHASPVLAKEWSMAEEELEKNDTYEGVDAAAMTDASTIIYFAGCQYVEIDPFNFNIVNNGTMEELGLPCNVDAAFDAPNPDFMMVIKGSKLYLWNTYYSDAYLVPDSSTELPFIDALNLCDE